MGISGPLMIYTQKRDALPWSESQLIDLGRGPTFTPNSEWPDEIDRGLFVDHQMDGVNWSENVAFRDNIFANPEGLIAYINKHPEGARVRPDQKVVFFDEWEGPAQRLKGATGILRALVGIAEKGAKPIEELF